MPAADRPPSFLFWVADFLSDPVVASMTTEEVGAYVLLLLYAWQHEPQGVLEDDDATLAALTRLGERWPSMRARVLRPFELQPGRIVSRRLVREARAAAERIERARRSGAKGAKRRWGNGVDGVPMPEPGMPITITSSIQEKKTRSAAAPAGAGPAQERVLDLLGSVAASKALPRPETPRKATLPTEAAWQWLRANANEREAEAAMRFVGWLIKTGTRDGAMILALVKHHVVHKPRNPHAYYTPQGDARSAICVRVASDAAVAEHERIKREERAFAGRVKS